MVRSLRALQELDVSDLDFDDVGSWPVVVKAIVWALVFAGVLVLGYVYHIKDLQLQLEVVQQQEQALKKDYEKKAFQAANLEAYKKQMIEMKESFGALVSQLPSDTEVPGLLEDITNNGVINGLEFSTITLKPEVVKEFYVELPISITAKGKFHDIGAFVSGMAGLPRIVTLHDFTISRDKASAGKADEGMLSLLITAKTYRYKDEEA